MLSYRQIRPGEFCAHCFQQHAVLAQGIKRFAQILRQPVDFSGFALLFGTQGRIDGNLRGEFQLAMKAVESCSNKGAQGNIGIGSELPGAQLHVETAYAEAALRLAYNSTNYADFFVNSGGDLTITPSGGDVTVNDNLTALGTLTVGPDSVSAGAANAGKKQFHGKFCLAVRRRIQRVGCPGTLSDAC